MKLIRKLYTGGPTKIAGRSPDQVREYLQLLLNFYTEHPESISNIPKNIIAYLDDEMYEKLFDIYNSYYDDGLEKVASGLFGNTLKTKYLNSKISSNISNVGNTVLKEGAHLTDPIRNQIAKILRHYIGGVKRKFNKFTAKEDFSLYNGKVRFMHDMGLAYEANNPNKVKAVYGGPQVFTSSDPGGENHFRTADEWEALLKEGKFLDNKLFVAAFPVKDLQGHYQFKAGTLEDIKAMDGYTSDIKLDPFITTNGYKIGLIDNISFPISNVNVDSLNNVNNLLQSRYDSLDNLLNSNLHIQLINASDSLQLINRKLFNLQDDFNKRKSLNIRTYMENHPKLNDFYKLLNVYSPEDILDHYSEVVKANPNLTKEFEALSNYVSALNDLYLDDVVDISNTSRRLGDRVSIFKDSIWENNKLIKPIVDSIRVNNEMIKNNGNRVPTLHTTKGETIPINNTDGSAYQLLHGKAFLFGPTGINNLFTYKLGLGITPEILDSINKELKIRPKYLYIPDNGTFENYIDENEDYFEKSLNGYTRSNYIRFNSMLNGTTPVYMEYYTPEELLKKSQNK